jgi:hypothetical protein
MLKSPHGLHTEPQVTWIGHSATNCNHKQHITYMSCWYIHIHIQGQHYLACLQNQVTRAVTKLCHDAVLERKQNTKTQS